MGGTHLCTVCSLVTSVAVQLMLCQLCCTVTLAGVLLRYSVRAYENGVIIAVGGFSDKLQVTTSVLLLQLVSVVMIHA